MTIEMFPNAKLLSKQCPENPTPFNSQDQCLTHDQVMKSISEAHSSEINKLCSVAEIQNMLEVSATNPKYKTFPPVLFLGMQEDLSLKTVFRNWKLLAKILKATLHGITSLHQETTGGPKTNAQKWNFKHIMSGSIAWAAIISILLS
ncbi:uncharacterized protein BJ212DRAFT_1306791 [Suillus subaureus]|uniref:Uncharacterized protein n=1 Tax=Suillus subaureus TaxID=48587 RepID=A0A9P7ATE0_9AGAM|nr:uncharacterized protein BJ212DRAFT_1306791 [Suillus subaureus]KAG1794719.1 hypothetical protein BJ212DRAFT_1306791 [Suillus subaureus]